MKAINIQWDVDNHEDLEMLPKEVVIPDYIDSEDEDAVSDYISDITGFCHCGFSLDFENEEEKEIMKLDKIIDEIRQKINVCKQEMQRIEQEERNISGIHLYEEYRLKGLGLNEAMNIILKHLDN